MMEYRPTLLPLLVLFALRTVAYGKFHLATQLVVLGDVCTDGAYMLHISGSQTRSQRSPRALKRVPQKKMRIFLSADTFY